METHRVIDSHHHFWDPSTAPYPWMTDDLASIRRPFTPNDLAPLLKETGVQRTILVQTRSSLDETREFLDLAARTPFIAGVVGWVDLIDPAVGDTIDQLRSGPGGEKLAGIRHQVHDEPDPEWLLRPDVLRGLHQVADRDLAYDFLVRTRELPAALQVAGSFPNARFVIDHIAKPRIAAGWDEAWAEAMAPFFSRSNVWCKVSGMVTEADWHTWQEDDLLPYVQQVAEWFGPDRLLFGSDWPVSLLAAPYQRVVATYRALLQRVLPDSLDAVMAGNATSVYRLS